MTDFEDRITKATGGHDTVPDAWMAATSMFSLIKKDPGLLWLKYHGQDEFETDTTTYAFTPFICQKGHEFEVTWLKMEAPKHVRAMENDWDVLKLESFLHT